MVSIHAPAWGATLLPREESTVTAGFNPRARVGRDKMMGPTTIPVTWFQSTRPRGARPIRATRSAPARDVSIHAPAWGATHAGFQGGRHFVVSIHAPAWGATPHCDYPRQHFRCFNPRARVGRDIPAVDDVAGDDDVSIHAPAWGATIYLNIIWRILKHVSIHAPAWGATSAVVMS